MKNVILVAVFLGEEIKFCKTQLQRCVNYMVVWLSKSFGNIIHSCYAEPYHK